MNAKSEVHIATVVSSQVITKLLYLLSQGETFSKVRGTAALCVAVVLSVHGRTLSVVPLHPQQKEQSEVFFSVTKLFQNKDVNLRRMVRCHKRCPTPWLCRAVLC